MRKHYKKCEIFAKKGPCLLENSIFLPFKRLSAQRNVAPPWAAEIDRGDMYHSKRQVTGEILKPQ